MKNTQNVILKDTNAGSINLLNNNHKDLNTNGTNKFDISLNMNKEIEGYLESITNSFLDGFDNYKN